jgi:tartrate dehydrogenase/decarboxylase / D-malate dehydrogenase
MTAIDDGHHHIRIAAVPGDGIGPEVMAVTLPLLQSAAALDGRTVRITELDWGGERYLRTGAAMPEDGVEQLREFDAVLFGAVGRPDIRADVSVWTLILPLRQALDLYVNLRPVWSWDGIAGPLRDGDGVDFLVIRENTEGEYVGAGGRTRAGTPHETAVEIAVHTRRGIERIAHEAFARARARRGLVTLVTKSNASRYGYPLWDEVVAAVSEQYNDVRYEQAFVDAMAARMIERPRSLDVLLCSNLFGDILSDLGAPLQGGLGMAPSANVHPGGDVPGIFEPVHGSAPDIAGEGIANPIACVLSAAMLLEQNRCPAGAAALHRAVADALRDGGAQPRDLGGTASTKDVGEAIGRSLQALTLAGRSERAV